MHSKSNFSVLLSVYKKEDPRYLKQALESIWDWQTLKPTQIVIVRDGPLTKELDKILTYWQEKIPQVVFIISLEKNMGLATALNYGIKSCNQELIARMDTDDIALPERFEKQIQFMLANPDIAAASAQIEEWDEALTKKINTRTLPTSSSELTRFAKRRSPLTHPASIFRKSIVEKMGGYPILQRAQDYGLWSLLLKNGYKLGNHPETLLKMRTGSDLLSRRGLSYFRHEYKLLCYQKEIGFLSGRGFLINLFARSIIRLPVIQRLVYLIRK